MALFKKKSVEEKAAAKEKDAIQVAKLKAIMKQVHFTERTTHSMALSMTSMLIKDDDTILLVRAGEDPSTDTKIALVAIPRGILIGWFKGMKTGSTELPYSDIDKVEVGRNFRGAWIKIHNGSQVTSVEKSVSDFEDLRDIIRNHQNAPTTPGGTSTSVNDLTKLAELHSAGVLSDEEFAAAKSKALGL